MPDTLLGILIGSLMFGLYLFLRGWYHREVDGGKYCARCHYRVDQATSKRCPECGLDLETRAPLAGRPVRRMRMVAVGLILSGISAGFLGVHASGALRRIDFYQYYPTWYLLRADSSAAGGFANRETDELRRRALNADLSAGEIVKLRDFLVRRATNMWMDPQLRGQLTFSGLTLSILQDHKPDDAQLLPLLQAILDHEGSVGRLHDLILTSTWVAEPHVMTLNESAAPFDDPNMDLSMEIRFISLEVRQGEKKLLAKPWQPGIPLPIDGPIDWREPCTLHAEIEFRIGETAYSQQLPSSPGPLYLDPRRMEGLIRPPIGADLNFMDRIAAPWHAGEFVIEMPGHQQPVELSALLERLSRARVKAAEEDRGLGED